MLAGAAGLIYALYQTTIWFFQGFQAGLIAFTAAVMGGIGNLKGAVLGGLIIGCIQQISDNRIGTEWTPGDRVRLPDPDHGLPAAGPARRGDEGGRMSAAASAEPAPALGALPRDRAAGARRARHRVRDRPAVLPRAGGDVHRQRDARAGLRGHGARAEHRRRLRRPARPRLRRLLRDRRLHDRLVRLRLLRVATAATASTSASASSPSTLPGIHLNFLLVVRDRGRSSARSPGMLIGLPTLRLRGDYIAIVTLAFGEIIGRVRDQRRRRSRLRHELHAHRRPPGHHAGRPDRPAGRRAVRPARTSAVVLDRARRWC